MTAGVIEFPLRPDRSHWLADHSPGGSPVVAGAVLVEWLLGPHGGVLRNVRFRRPLRVPPQGALVERAADLVGGAESVWLTSPRVKPDGSVSGNARVASAERHAYERPGKAADPLVGPHVVVVIPDPTFHGPTFQVLGEPVRLGPAGLDATLRAPGPGPEVAPWDSVRDVRLLDGLFQVAGLCRTRAGLDRGAPASASSLRWAVPEGEAGVWEARVRWIDPGDPAGMHLWCLDEDGRTVWEVEGYRAAPAKFTRWEERE